MSNFKRYYQNNNIVFVTIVTYNRIPFLLKNIDKLRKSLINPNYSYKILAGVVLQDHMHLLIQADKAEEFPKIIASFKASFSKQMPINFNQTEEQLRRREKGIWQRKYYDHIIRDEKDLHRHLDYIHFNPMKHCHVKPIDWEFSSFKKFVQKGYYDKNWCNFGDKNKITELNYE